MIKHISEKLTWYEKTPFYYTSLSGYRCFRWNRVVLGLWKFRIELKLRDLHWFFQKIFYHYPKCQNCSHSLLNHVSYDEIAIRDGVCVSFDTPNWDCCGCEDWK